MIFVILVDLLIHELNWCSSSNHNDVIYFGAALYLVILENAVVVHQGDAIIKQLNMVPLHPLGQVEAMADGVLEQANSGLAEIVDFVNLALRTGHGFKNYSLVIKCIVLIVRLRILNF